MTEPSLPTSTAGPPTVTGPTQSAEPTRPSRPGPSRRTRPVTAPRSGRSGRWSRRPSTARCGPRRAASPRPLQPHVCSSTDRTRFPQPQASAARAALRRPAHPPHGAPALGRRGHGLRRADAAARLGDLGGDPHQRGVQLLAGVPGRAGDRELCDGCCRSGPRPARRTRVQRPRRGARPGRRHPARGGRPHLGRRAARPRRSC